MTDTQRGRASIAACHLSHLHALSNKVRYVEQLQRGQVPNLTMLDGDVELGDVAGDPAVWHEGGDMFWSMQRVAVSRLGLGFEPVD